MNTNSSLLCNSMSVENNSFLDDISDLENNTFPIHIIKSSIIGILCGMTTFLYYSILKMLLESVWNKLPAYLFPIVVDNNIYKLRILWSLVVSLSCGLVCGSAYKYIGKPEDLNATIHCVHKDAYVPTKPLGSLIICSLATVVGGMSLGPEAPIVTICGMLSGFLAKRWFRIRDKDNCLRFVLCGMASGFSVFFGANLGGSLFALEILHRQGYEYFEHMIYAVWSGAVSTFISLSLSGRSFNGVWYFQPFGNCSVADMVCGCFLGLSGCILAVLLGEVVKLQRKLVKEFRLVEKPVCLALLGAMANTLIGILLPQSNFWGEMEIQRVIQLKDTHWNYYFTMENSANLDNVTPTVAYYILLAFAKLICVSIALTMNFCGGFIFPIMFIGVAFGRALSLAIPQLPVETSCLCCAAGISVSLTKTPLGTPLVLAQLSNSMESFPAVFGASLVSICATHYYHPFLSSQTSRSDILKKFLLFD